MRALHDDMLQAFLLAHVALYFPVSSSRHTFLMQLAKDNSLHAVPPPAGKRQQPACCILLHQGLLSPKDKRPIHCGVSVSSFLVGSRVLRHPC